MPCRDSESYQPMSIRGVPVDNPVHLRKIAFLEAALCMVLQAVQDSHPDTGVNFDYKQAGINKKELQTWWTNHQLKDQKRRRREARERADRRDRKAALEKLTSKEKRLLGIDEPTDD